MPETSPPPTSRRFSPTPVETPTTKVRRFAVEPVETTTRSSKKEDVQKIEEASVEKKDFAPKRRFLPQPVETSFKSSKQPANAPPTPEPTPESIPTISPPEETPKARRKFVPELIETTKRTKKAGDPRPATLPTDKTDLTPGVPNIYTSHAKQKIRPSATPVPPKNTPNNLSPHLLPHIAPLPPRRQGSMRPHCNTRRSTRQDSFTPGLDPILSDDNSQESDDDDTSPSYREGSYAESTPSLSGSLGSSEDSLMRLQLARTRESCDDRFSGYLLALAAKAAEKQLKEQALAAFPNETMHENVEHFYDREIEGQSDNDSVEGVGLLSIEEPQIEGLRRKSTEVGWAAKEIQEHQEKLNRLREEETNHKIAAEATKPTFKDPFWTNGMTFKAARDPVDLQKERELEKMRSAASPPMLGGDLKFRMCPSPKPTKFESDQIVDIQPHRSDSGGGLWHGYCVADEPGEFLSPSIKGPPLIQTPHPTAGGDPFAQAFASELRAAPSGTRSPKTDAGVRMLSGIDERLKLEVKRSKAEEALLEEFDDTFVTQVYNYLSLGYPSLARQYDPELSRISHIVEEELRVDDSKSAAGHIGLRLDGDGRNKVGEGREKGARWKALRLYIHEWGRQHPSMSNGAMGPSAMGPSAWGVRARRGSWAI